MTRGEWVSKWFEVRGARGGKERAPPAFYLKSHPTTLEKDPDPNPEQGRRARELRDGDRTDAMRRRIEPRARCRDIAETPSDLLNRSARRRASTAAALSAGAATMGKARRGRRTATTLKAGAAETRAAGVGTRSCAPAKEPVRVSPAMLERRPAMFDCYSRSLALYQVRVDGTGIFDVYVSGQALSSFLERICNRPISVGQ